MPFPVVLKLGFQSFVRSFIRSFILSFIRSFVLSFIRSFVCSFVLSFVCSFVLSFSHSFFRSFVLPFVRSFFRSFVRSFVCSFVRSFHRYSFTVFSSIGQVLTYNTIRDVIKFCAREKLVLFADEVYQETLFSNEVQFHSCKKVLRDLGPEYLKFQLMSMHSVSKGIYGE